MKEKRVEKEKKKINLNRVITLFTVVVMTFTFFVMPLQKGGFFKQDMLLVNSLVLIVGIAVLLYNIFKSKEKFKFNLIDLLVMIFAFTFFIPYLLGTSVSVNDALFEAIKYGVFCNIYFLTKWLLSKDNNRKYINILINVIIISSVLLSLLGIDQIGARALENFLNKLDIYYLSELTTRLSSTMQYANGLAAFLIVGIFLCIYQYFEGKDKKTKAFYILALFIQFIALIFSMSRGVMLISSICLVILIFLLRSKEKRFDYIILLLLTLIFSVIFALFGIKLITIGAFLVVWFMLACFSVFIYFTTIMYENIKEKIYNNLDEKKFYIILSAIIIIILVTGILIINISSPIIIEKTAEEDDYTKIVREYSYISKNSDYKINLDVINKTENMDMIVEIFSINTKGEYTALATKKIEDLARENYTVNVKTLDDTKNICFIFSLYNEGSLELNSISLNGAKKKVNYALIDFDTIHRLDITEFIDQSFDERRYITEDAIKIWLKSPIIGIGGDGFRYKYQEVQSYPYISTETHSYLTELLVNTGLIGLITYIILITFVVYKGIRYIKREKDDLGYKIIFIIFIFLIIHSIFDLDFSFAINTYIFAFLLAIITKDIIIICKKYKDIKIYSRNLYMLCGIIANIILLCITISSLSAYNLKIPVYDDKSLTLSNIEKTITKMEQRVNLDKYEALYRQKLNKEYARYKTLLIAEYSKSQDLNNKKLISEKVTNLLPKIKDNIDKLYKYSEYDRTVVADVANTYFSNFINFASLDELKENKSLYLEKSIEIIKNMSARSPINISLYEKKAEMLYTYYIQLLNYELTDNGYNKEKILEDLKNEIIIIPKTIEENYINKKLKLNEEALKNIYQIIDKINEKGVL